MARIPNQPQMGQDLMDLMGLAQVSQTMGLNQPPEIGNLLKLLGMAGELQQQEQGLGLKRQELELQREKQAQMSPEMFAALMYNPEVSENPQARQNLVQRAAPGILPAGVASEKAKLPELGVPSSTKVPKGRLETKSQKAFMGYQPPPGSENVQAVLDENGNIINFVRAGTEEPVRDFVPSAESVGGWGASKYAVAQQMKAMGRALGLVPQPQKIQPY